MGINTTCIDRIQHRTYYIDASPFRQTHKIWKSERLSQIQQSIQWWTPSDWNYFPTSMIYMKKWSGQINKFSGYCFRHSLAVFRAFTPEWKSAFMLIKFKLFLLKFRSYVCDCELSDILDFSMSKKRAKMIWFRISIKKAAFFAVTTAILNHLQIFEWIEKKLIIYLTNSLWTTTYGMHNVIIAHTKKVKIWNS